MRKRQQGVALILVLWVTLLMSVIAASFALSARTESVQSAMLFGSTQARFYAEAGLHRAVFELRNPDLETRWIADGRSYEVGLDDVLIDISITDESGKIDINRATEDMLIGLFMSAGKTDIESLAIVDKILDWRDADEEVRLEGAEDEDYISAGYAYGAKDDQFDTVTELQQVMDIDYELFRRVEPAITVYSGRPQINPAFAPKEALLAMEGMTPELVQEYIDLRQTITDINEPLPELIAGQPGQLRGGGTTFSLVVKATLPNGQWSSLDATIRMGGTISGRPFRIIRWRDNEHT
ncbi:general secretion pathway protein GspK [Marinicella sp. W31]|uniref:general secretion pathway protein GspK n=1 Tax=Marinicella sp. W31 TaxID=3023713 RepID=UPI0037576610